MRSTGNLYSLCSCYYKRRPHQGNDRRGSCRLPRLYMGNIRQSMAERHRIDIALAQTAFGRRIIMADYIKCRNCESPDCKGCNLKNLETMLNNGKFDCLMNGNRCVNKSADVAPVRHARWKSYGKNLGECSECGEIVSVRSNYCPNCGANMRGSNDE